MKKTLIVATTALGLLVGAASTAYAYEVHLPWTVNIYSVSTPEERGSHPGISYFDRGSDRCYVVRATNNNTGMATDNVAISCLKR